MGSMEDALRKAGVNSEPPEPPAEKACARCGKTFRPSRPQHKLCPECITVVRAERAVEKPAAGPAAKAGEGGENPDAEKSGAEKPAAEKPAEAAAAASNVTARRGEPERQRPPRRERPPGTQVRQGVPPRGIAPATGSSLPAGYLEGGYFTPEGSLRSELLTHWAEQIAQGIAWPATDSTAHQLRVFHNHVKRAVAACRFGGQPIELVLNEIQKLKPFAAERAARRKVAELFRRFLDANVDRVTDEKTLLAFAQHFQAVVAYAGGLLHMRKERR